MRKIHNQIIFAFLRTGKKKKSGYAKLKLKVFFQTMGMIVLAFCIIYTLYRRFWFGRVGDWIVAFLQNVFHLDYMDARNIYQYGMRENLTLIIFIAVISYCSTHPARSHETVLPS